MEEKKVLLPQTREELDAFIAKLVKEYGIPDDDETHYSVANMIMHLPATQAHACESYFAHGVLRGIAQKVAYKKTEEVRISLIARDEAEKAKEKTELQAQKETALKLVGSDDQPLQNA